MSEEQRSEFFAGPPTRVSQRVGVQEGCSAGRMPAEFHRGLLASIVASCLVSACTEARESYVIPGPTAPSRVVTEQPLMWDTRAELADWVENDATKGSVTLEDEGKEAFVRLRLGSSTTVLRGPDLTVAAEGVRGARLRVRLRHDRELLPGAALTPRLEVRFEPLRPSNNGWQPSMSVNVPPSEEWHEIALQHCASCLTSHTVRYGYLYLNQTNPMTLDIDWIAFMR